MEDEVEARDESVKLSDSMSSKENASLSLSVSESSDEPEDQFDVGEYAVA